MADDSNHDPSDDGGVPVHVHEPKLYAGILAALLALTLVTVVVARLDLGLLIALGREDERPWNLGVALLIAATQAGLLVVFFMHLKGDKHFSALFFAGSLLLFGVFFAFTTNDTSARGRTGDRYHGAFVDPDTGLRAPGGISGPISGEVLEEGLAVPEPDGAALFSGVCSACHSIGGGVVVGPDLAGVTQRRTEEWLIPFITSTSTVIASGDETAVALFAEFGELPMPDVPYSEAQIRAVLAYIEAESGGGEGTEGEGEDVDDIVDDILGDEDEEPWPEEEAGAIDDLAEGDDFIDSIMGDDDEEDIDD